MRCAVPSSNVGSCDSAKAAAERDSGVDAAAALAGVACTGRAVPGLAGSDAVPEPAEPALCPNADAVACIVAMATIVMVRMLSALGMRHDGADAENKQARPFKPNQSGGTRNQQFKVFGMLVLIIDHESCTLIKLLWQPLHCRNSWVEL